MAEISTIARPYAKAAFALAVEQHELNQWADALHELAMIVANDDMRTVIANPSVHREALMTLFFSVAKNPLNNQIKNFLQVLVENDRVEFLPNISAQFDDLKNAHDSTADADIISAFPLDEADLSLLAASLEKRFNRRIKPTVHVDNELIGGVKVIVGDEVLDSSVRGQLQSIASVLRSEDTIRRPVMNEE